MAINVIWDDDSHTVLRYDLEGRWTWAEFAAGYNEALLLMSRVQHTAHFIVNPVDAVSRNYLPPGTLFNAANLHRAAPPNAGISVVVGGGGLFRALHSVGQKLFSHLAERYAFTDTLEEARAHLRRA